MQIQVPTRVLSDCVNPRIVFLLVALLIGLACIGLASQERLGPVRGTSFQLVDEKGRVVAELTGRGTGASLQFFDGTGRPRVALSFDDKDGGTIHFSDAAGHELAKIRGAAGTATLTLQGTKDGAVIWHRAEATGAAIVASGANEEFGAATIAGTSQGGRVSILDAKGIEIAGLTEHQGAGVATLRGTRTERLLQLQGGTGSLTIYDKDGAARLAMICDEIKGPSFNVYDKDEGLRGVLAEHNGDGRIILFGDRSVPAFEAIGGVRGAAVRLCNVGAKQVERILLNARSGAGALRLSDHEGGKVLTLPAQDEQREPPQAPERK
jgi:hypothetical protein